MQDPLDRIVSIMADTLHALIDYALRHFTAEETYLASRGYPELESHQRVHREFTARILALQQDLAEQRPVLATSLMKLLSQLDLRAYLRG